MWKIWSWLNLFILDFLQVDADTITVLETEQFLDELYCWHKHGKWSWHVSWTASGTKVALLLCVPCPETSQSKAGNRVWEGPEGSWRILRCPQGLLLTHGGKCSDQQSKDFRLDSGCALQVCPVLQTKPAVFLSEELFYIFLNVCLFIGWSVCQNMTDFFLFYFIYFWGGTMTQ